MPKKPKANELINLAKGACASIISASIYWPAGFEKKNPESTKAVNLAGEFLRLHKIYKEKERENGPPQHWICCGVVKPIDRRCSCGESSD